MQEYQKFFEENPMWGWGASFMGGLILGYVIFGLWLKVRGHPKFSAFVVYICIVTFILMAVEGGLFPNRVDFFKFFFVGILFCDYTNYRKERRVAAMRAIMGEAADKKEAEEDG